MEKSVGEERCRQVLQRSVGEECPQGRSLQRFAVVVELTLHWKRCWMRCALESASFGVKDMQRIQNRST